MTFAEIHDFVAAVERKEGGTPNRSFYLTLANQWCRLVSRRASLYIGDWTDATEGGLSVDGYRVTLPTGSRGLPTEVSWNGSVLAVADVAVLDLWEPGWRSVTGDPGRWMPETPRTILLDSAPTGTGAGLLVIRGPSYLPAFSDEEGAVNPLDWVPESAQLGCAHYIISMLPIEQPKIPNTSPEAMLYAQAELTSRQQTRQTHAALYRELLGELDSVVLTSTRRQFAY